VGPHAVATGTQITVQLILGDLIVEVSKRTIYWVGDIGNTQFRVKVSGEEKPGKLDGSAIFYVNRLEISRVEFSIEIAGKKSQSNLPSTTLPMNEKRYKTAFASYARKDLKKVMKDVRLLRKLGIDVYADVDNLKSGDRYEEIIMKVVPTRDVFYLFWSRAARRSKWVEKEWKCALATRGISYISPIPLEPPEKAPPPTELAELHFRDPEMAYFSNASWWKLW
jgi:hypothetical protein